MKNRLKTLLITPSTLLCMLLFSQAYAGWSGTHQIGRIQLTTYNSAYFRPVGSVDWGGDECPTATYVYIENTDANFDSMLALTTAAQLNGTPVRYRGTCVTNSNGSIYLKADYMLFN